MIDIPAICENCNTIFPSGIIGGGGATVTVVGSKSGPCPKCNGMGNILDGTYKLIGDFIEILSAPESTIEELKGLEKILENAKEEKITSDRMQKEIQNETPNLSPLLDLLPKTREEKQSAIKFFIQTLLTIVGLIIAFQNQSDNNHMHEENIEVEHVIKKLYQIEEVNIEMPRKVEKIGRNDPCFCGSGVKYKRCHGK